MYHDAPRTLSQGAGSDSQHSPFIVSKTHRSLLGTATPQGEDSIMESPWVQPDPTSPDSDASRSHYGPYSQINGVDGAPNPTDLAVPFLQKFKTINKNRVQVQKLRVKAGEERGQMKEALRQLSAAGDQVVKALKDLVSQEDMLKISSSFDKLKDAVKDVDKRDIEYDDVQGQLVPAEWALKESEQVLYSHLLGLGSQIPTDIETNDKEDIALSSEMLRALDVIEDGADPLVAGPFADVLVPKATIMKNELQEAEFVHEGEQQSGLGMLDTNSAHGSSRKRQPDASLDLNGPGTRPIQVASYSEPNAAQNPTNTTSLTQRDYLAAQSARVHSILARLEAEYAVLQEEAERRAVVGVPLDRYSQERLTAYPQRRGMLWKELARIENAAAAFDNLVGRSEAYAYQESEAFFRLDQFNHVTLDDRIDDEDDQISGGKPQHILRSEVEQLAARAADPWADTNRISQSVDGFEEWLSKITRANSSHISFLYAYVTIWIYTWLKASFWTWTTFASNNGMNDDERGLKFATIQDYVLRRWNKHELKHELPYHHESRNQHTSLRPNDDDRSWRDPNRQLITGSQSSLRPQNGNGAPYQRATRSLNNSPAPARPRFIRPMTTLNAIRPSIRPKDTLHSS